MAEVEAYMTATNSQANKSQSSAVSVRWLAMDIVHKVLFHDAFIHEKLNETLNEQPLSLVNRNLLTQLVYGTVQHYLTLDAMLRPFVKKANRVKKWLWSLLLVSLYQHYYLNQIPDYAIVNEAVRVTKKRGNPTLSRFTNGVLRHVMREYTTQADFIATLSELPWRERISVQYSLPLIWVDYLRERFGEQKVEAIAASLLENAPITVRVTQKGLANEPAIVATLKDEGYGPQASAITPQAYRLTSGNPMHLSAFEHGEITVQDASAQLAARVLDAQSGESVLDACAAPGGKTVQLAEVVSSQGEVISGDIQPEKLPKITENVQRMQVAEQVKVQTHDATQLVEIYGRERFDRILVDAPCSGIGLFRRKPDTKYHKTLQDVKALQHIQLTILSSAVNALKKGGTLVYSTCTITAEENQQVVDQLLATHPELALEPIKPERSDLQSAVTDKGTLEILPDAFQSDGFFIARLQKR